MQRSSNPAEEAYNRVCDAFGVFSAEVGFYTNDRRFGYPELSFDSVLIGSDALAVHAYMRDFYVSKGGNDVDIYTDHCLDDLDILDRLPQGSKWREDGSQYHYNLAAPNANSRFDDTVVDVITDFESAFNWHPQEAEEVEELLSQEIGKTTPIVEGAVTVYLPRLEVLRETFEHSDRDYCERLDIIDSMLDKPANSSVLTL